MNKTIKRKFRKKFMTKDKRILIGIISLLSIIISIIFSFSIIFDLYLEYALKRCYYCNTYFVNLKYPHVSKEEISKVKNIDHVVDVYSQDSEETIVFLDKINDQKKDGKIRLIGLSEEELKNMSSNNYEDKNDIICASRLYARTDIETEHFINRFEGIDMNNVQNINTYQITPDGKRVERTLNVVNTFENTIINYDDNTCYASHDLVSSMFLVYAPTFNTQGEYTDMIVSIDSIDNYEDVRISLEKMGYYASERVRMDYTLYNLVKKMVPISLGISIAIIILVIVIISSRNQINKEREYKILRSIGMNDEEYKKILKYEANYILFNAIVISFISVVFVYIILKFLTYFFPFVLFKLPIKLNLVGIGIFCIMICLIMHVVNYTCFYTLKKNKE